jgi:hypothetical protein
MRIARDRRGPANPMWRGHSCLPRRDSSRRLVFVGTKCPACPARLEAVVPFKVLCLTNYDRSITQATTPHAGDQYEPGVPEPAGTPENRRAQSGAHCAPHASSRECNPCRSSPRHDLDGMVRQQVGDVDSDSHVHTLLLEIRVKIRVRERLTWRVGDFGGV